MSKTQQWFYYDAFGKPGQFMDERSNITYLEHWNWGPYRKLADVTTSRDKDSGGTENQRTNFYYDGMYRLWGTNFPDNSWETTQYEFGQPKIFTVRKGPTKTIFYDARGREVSHTWNDPQTAGITRVWDDANRLTSLANTFSTINYTYDKAGQVMTESNNVTGAGGAAVLTSYRYPDGAPANLIYPNGFRLRRDYTARGQLSKTGSADPNGNWFTQFAAYTYLADGKIDIEDNPGNGMHTKFGYDGRGFINLTNTYRASSSQPYSKRDYYRDTRDRIYAWKKGTYATINPLENGRGDRYTYDAEGQLTAASYQALTPNTTPTGAQRTESFIYDQLGSRKGVNTIAGRGTITFYRRDNGLNQYLPSGTFLNHYDDEFAPNAPGLANGVQMQDGAHSVVFNALNQPIWMQSAATPPGTLMWVGHDPLGRCVKRWTSASPDPLTNPATYFYYDGWNMIQEGPNAATADRIYAHGNRIDEIVASQAGGAWCYHHFDARGHCILLTNASGGLVEQYDYNAFGKPYFYNGSGTSLPNGSAIGNRFLFTGRELIKDIGIYDFRNRIYEPELARFLQPDPKQFEAGDYNLYRYCHNDPINKSDPFGLKPPEVQYDDPKKQAAVEAQMKTLRSIPAFAEKFKQIDANKINNSVKDAQSRANPALKTPNGLKANATTNGSLLNSLRALFSPSALSSRPVTTYYDPNNGQTQSGRERAPIFGLANEIGEMFQANGVAGSSGGAAAYDNVSIRYENAARSALGAELRPENTNTVLHP